MTWNYDETTHQVLDADGGNIIGLTTVVNTGNLAFEPDEGFVGKKWGTGPPAPAIENTCFDTTSATTLAGVQYDLGAGNEINLNNTLTQLWFLYTAKTGDVVADAGNSVQLRVADSGATAATATNVNYARYDLTGAVDSGVDFDSVTGYYDRPLEKSWNNMVAAGANRATQVGTGCDLTDVRYIALWIQFQATNCGNDPAFAIDWYRSGTTFTCTGTETLEGLRTFDLGDPADRNADPDYGLVKGSGLFFEIWAKVSVGNDTAATTLTVEDSFVSFRPFAEELPYDWDVTNNATLTLGRLDQQAQEDYAVGGCSLVGNDEVYISNIRFENGSTGNLYATRIFRFDDLLLGEAAAGTDPTLDIRECDFDTIRNIEFRSTNLDISNTKIHDPLPTFLDAGQAWQDDAGTFTSVTTNWNNTTTATAIFPATETTADGHVFGFSEQFSSVEFEISTAGVGGVVTWQYWNGSTWSNLSNVVDGTSNFTAAVSDGAYDRYRVTWDQPSDWAVRNINTTGNLYYIRASISTVYTTNPQIQQGRIGQRRVGILVDAPNSVDGVNFFKCDRGLYFQSSVTVVGYEATDNFYDLVVDDLLTVTLRNSRFDPDKILQV